LSGPHSPSAASRHSAGGPSGASSRLPVRTGTASAGAGSATADPSAPPLRPPPKTSLSSSSEE
jgi:hypothetical protein